MHSDIWKIRVSGLQSERAIHTSSPCTLMAPVVTTAVGTHRLCRPVRKHFCCRGLTGRAAPLPLLVSLTHMYGPAVRRKRSSSSWGKGSCINVSGLRLELVVLRAIMEIGARAISLRDRPQWAKWVTSRCSSRLGGRPIEPARFKATVRELRALRGQVLARGGEKAAAPHWLDQYDPGRLNEQHAEVAISSFRYAAEDGAVARRDLLGDEPQPSSEIAAFGEGCRSRPPSRWR
jgi:hypothetical protein